VITSVAKDGGLPEKGIVTGKIFETLGLGRPMLLVAPAGSDAERVVMTAGLGRVFTGTNVDGIASYLLDVMRGGVPKPKNAQSYAWENIVTALDQCLRATIYQRGKKKTSGITTKGRPSAVGS
jgi:hypothetical protein